MARTYSTKTTIDVSACSHRNKSIMKWKNYNQENGYYFVTATLRNFTPLFAGGYQKNKNIRDTSIALQKKYLENMGSALPGVL